MRISMPANAEPRALSHAQIEQFIHDGFVRVENAVSRELVAAGRAILWRDLPCAPDDPTTWIRPVVRLGFYHDEPFVRAVNAPMLHAAFDQLVGKGRWLPQRGLGTFPVRFPHPDDPGDAGWHIDVSFPGPTSSWNERTDFRDWRANVTSHGKALLMLFLYSDTGENDAPTRIKIGSHLDVTRHLGPSGDAGQSHGELGVFCDTLQRPQTLATGREGDVYLCHPFLVHAAQMHRGKEPRFLAQPPLHPKEPFRLSREDGAYSPVEMAIRHALMTDA
jgi:hypothetical protein